MALDRSFLNNNNKAEQNPERLAGALAVIASYAPAFAFLVSLGFGVIYAIAVSGFPYQNPPTDLLWLAGEAAILGLFYLAVPRLLRNGKILFAEILAMVSFVIFILSVAYFWTSPALILYVSVWALTVLILWLCDNRNQRIAAVIVGIIGSIGIFILSRIQTANPAAVDNPITLLAAFYLFFIIAAWFGLILVVRIIQFRTLTARLTSSFFLLVMIPTVITAIIAAFQSYARDTNNIYLLLDTSTAVKEQQVNQIVSGMFQDLEFVLRDPVARQRLDFLFESEPNSSIGKINNSIVLGYLNNILEQTNNKYDEILLLDVAGNVVLSTNLENVGRNYENKSFFRQGLLKPFSTTETEVEEFGKKAFLVTEAVKDRTGKSIGIVVFKSKFDVFENIIEKASGSGIEDETYLVGENFQPLTRTLYLSDEIISNATLNAINGRQTGYNSYPSYSNNSVLGAYRWIPSLRAALIAEVASSKALLDTVYLIGIIFAVGFMAIALTIAAVYLTARTISTPITDLAQTAGLLSSGNLDTRSTLVRSDEIGQLSNSFNVMADRLQDFITGLEQKIADRTRDIQRQAVRLRVASEISRDAATATELTELLSRSAQLIRERFGFYHSGIFLLDDNREYAILSAASSDAGRLMLETGFKMRIGEGIVGFVAQSGESRIALDTDAEAIYYRNPLLPATRSELGLPLKVYNRVIGVLDVQSDTHNAFSEDDIATLQIMADQLAVAIERTRVYQDSQESLRELKRGYQGYTEESWANLSRLRNFIAGYTFEGVNIRPLVKTPGDAAEVIRTGFSQMTTDSTGRQKYTSLSVPIKIRGESVGIIRLNVKGESVPEDTVMMVEEITNRIGIALETSRLVYESRQQANREKAVSEAATRIGSTINFDEIMKSAVEELGKLMGDSEVVVQLNTGSENRA